MKLDQIGPAIKRLRKKQRLTQQMVSDRTAEVGERIHTGNISKVENGKSGLGDEGGGMRMRTFLQLCHGIKAKPREVFDEAEELDGIIPFGMAARKAPIISWVQAGGWTPSPEQMLDADEFVELPTTASNSSFGLRVQGDSMQTDSGMSFPEGCCIIVDPDVRPENRSFVVAQVVGSDEFTFKQLINDGAACYLKPLNRSYKMLEVDREINIIGVVIAWSYGYTSS